ATHRRSPGDLLPDANGTVGGAVLGGIDAQALERARGHLLDDDVAVHVGPKMGGAPGDHRDSARSQCLDRTAAAVIHAFIDALGVQAVDPAKRILVVEPNSLDQAAVYPA